MSLRADNLIIRRITKSNGNCKTVTTNRYKDLLKLIFGLNFP